MYLMTRLLQGFIDNALRAMKHAAARMVLKHDTRSDMIPRATNRQLQKMSEAHECAQCGQARSDEHTSNSYLRTSGITRPNAAPNEKEVLFHGLGRENSVDLGSVKL
jgi:hypothetical protein